MDEAKKKRLEQLGWKVGTVEEFLGALPSVTPEEDVQLSAAVNEGLDRYKEVVAKIVVDRATVLVEQYAYTAAWSEEDEAFVARVGEWPSLATHGDSAEAATKELKSVVAASIESCLESKEEFPQPWSVDGSRSEQFKGAIKRAGLPLPPGEDLQNARWIARDDEWYAKTEQGWFWFDARKKVWMPSSRGP